MITFYVAVKCVINLSPFIVTEKGTHLLCAFPLSMANCVHCFLTNVCPGKVADKVIILTGRIVSPYNEETDRRQEYIIGQHKEHLHKLFSAPRSEK